MKVLFITDPGSIGGANKSLIDLVSELKNKHIEIIVVNSIKNDLNIYMNRVKVENYSCGHRPAMCPRSPFKWKRPLKYLYEFIQYYLSIPSSLRYLEKHIDFNSIDLIHTNSARNDLGCYISKKYGIKHVMHIREFGQEDFDCVIYKEDYYNFLNKYTDRFIAISDAVSEAWIAKGIEKDKVCVIYNGIDISDLRKKTSYDIYNNYLKLVIVGGVCEAKGQLQCIEALNLLPLEIKNRVSLDIIGWGDPLYIMEIKKRINNYNLKNVCLLGAREDIHLILKDYDVALMCSKSEGFGRVTAEYMFAGIGIIASDRGANRELIDDGINGLIYKYNDNQDLAEKIEFLYLDRAKIREYGKLAQQKAFDSFTIQRNADKIIQIYKSVVD